MKKFLSILAAVSFLAGILLFIVWSASATDQRIQYTEPMTGANHPVKSDTLNRLTLIEHNSDGTHSAITTTVGLSTAGTVTTGKVVSSGVVSAGSVTTSGGIYSGASITGANIYTAGSITANTSGAFATLLSAGTTTIQGTTSISGNINSSGTNTLSGTQNITGAIVSTNTISSSGTTTISGAVTLSGGLTSSVTTTISGGLISSGVTTLSGGLVSSGTTTLSGATIISNGSGTVTTLKATGQITSTVSTGTPPFVVSSTTEVVNLRSATSGTSNTATTATNLLPADTYLFTTSTTTQVNSVFHVTTGDILFVNAYTTWTSNTAEQANINVGGIGVTGAWIDNTSISAFGGHAVSKNVPASGTPTVQIFGIIVTSQTGTLTLSNILTATTPTAISNKIGTIFLRRQ